jgi:hypothetical protein
MPFLLFWVVGIFGRYFATFISENAPVLTVKPFSAIWNTTYSFHQPRVA